MSIVSGCFILLSAEYLDLGMNTDFQPWNLGLVTTVLPLE
jgi:hypothetical protein